MWHFWLKASTCEWNEVSEWSECFGRNQIYALNEASHTHTHIHEGRLYLSVAAVNPRLSCRRIRQRHLTDNWKRVNKLTSFVESLRRRAFTLFSKRATERSYKDYWAILPAALKYFRRRKVDFLVCEKCKWFILNNAL